MAWLALNIQADNGIAEALSEFLLSHGALYVSIEDAEAEQPDEVPLFGEPNMPPPGFWQKNIINALLDENCQVEQLVALAKAEFGLDSLPYQIETVAEQDWVRLTQSQFDPIKILDDLWIVPTWHDVSNTNAINIRLDPGLAFGTGSHPTTFLCLKWLKQVVKPSCRVIDYGCGSGILSIAAKKIGAHEVLGIDIDHHAIEASEFNAEQNEENIRFLHAQNFKGDFSADIVVANILSSALIVLAPALAQLCKPGGQLALSGILQAQIDLITEAYQPWFDIQVLEIHEGWVLMGGKRKNLA